MFRESFQCHNCGFTEPSIVLFPLNAVIFYCNSIGNTKNRIFFSPCGNMMLLMMGFEKIFLWQKIEKNNSGKLINVRQ